MRVERTYETASPFCDLSDFADRYGLTLQLRRAGRGYVAGFDDVYIRIVSCLLDQPGYGATEDEAVISYARRIACQPLVLHATRPDERIEVLAPFLVHARRLAGAAS